MDDDALLRFSRHILLDEIGIEGQQKILDSHVLIVGMGGLGSPAALYLAAAGVGKLSLADGDDVDMTNLQRQVIHTQTAIGQNKAESARDTLAYFNAISRVDIYPHRLDEAQMQDLVAAADVVLDCSDNFVTRHALNRVCFRHKKPLVSGAAISFSGQITVFDFRQAKTPCYHCLFPAEGNAGGQNCATFGVLSPLVGVVGAMQALEALKLIGEFGDPLVGRLQMVDVLSGKWQTLAYGVDPQCPVCQPVNA
ncbi:HesA/MoeB/ThiF family protein [Leeia sp. TBRC 13508]|uniref:HesA/MoeB/ThiF family protein n=1 Tax=Leeia speluncae TaxID=2884804 RepID=A0ABS8D5M1_9NEIS|nr:HesA/MoeB/ThiF family protein [Leeia speluncae]MCB6183511.1 HesA/MoeB/ThiF family protein [Leeia speluncae]